MILARNNKGLKVRSGGVAFRFANEWIAIGPDLEVMAQYLVRWVYVLHDNSVLTGVAVPPFVAHLTIGLWELFEGSS